MPQFDKTKETQHTEIIEHKAKLDTLASKAADALRNGQTIESVISAEEIEVLRKRYSQFEDEHDNAGFISASTHVVHKVSTPRPFLHLMSSNHDRDHGCYGSFWDGSGSGFSCLDSALAGQVTSHKDPSYVPTAPRASDHRHFYIREETPDGLNIRHLFPQRGVDEDIYDCYSCRQEMGTVTMQSECGGLAAELLVFVPVDGPFEVLRLKLSNTSGVARTFDLFTRVNWGLESYPGYYFDPRVVSEGRCYRELNALVALNNDQNNKHPRTGFFMSSERFEDFDLSAEAFTGGGLFSKFPSVVERGKCTGSLGVQPVMGLIAAARWRIELGPGTEETIDFLLGVTDPDIEKGRVHLGGLRTGLFDNDGVGRELDKLRNSWQMMVDMHKSATPDTELDRFFNIWSKYQAKNTARWTRALDKVGYRDLIQDLMGVNSFDPGYTRTMLPVALRHQFPDGRAVRQFAKFAGAPHDTRMYMDSTSWIPDTLVGYCQETGDLDLLETHEGYLNPKTMLVDDSNGATVYEHALRGVYTLYEHRGLHGLCKIEHGDWNDALDGVGRDGEGVSVWLSMALVYAAQRMRELTSYLGDKENTRNLDEIVSVMTSAINEAAWDGSHYVYAFLPDGTPVGSDRNEEGKIHLNVNSWSLFNGVAATAGRENAVLNSIQRLETRLGYLLISPGYTARSKNVGRIADMRPGQFENASIYTHGQSFVVYALACMGQGDEAYNALKTILPENTLPDISTGPPHQISNFTVGIEHEHFGRNLYSNFSGSLPWLRKSIERMLGLLPDFDSLVIDPVVPSQWREYKVDKVWRGRRVTMSVINPEAVCTGVVEAELDGERLQVTEGVARIPLDSIPTDKPAELKIILGK